MASAPRGGGASQILPQARYQTGSGVPDDGARDVPDIALIASPEFPGVFWGHDVGGAGQITCCIGGTSLAAPIWAGFSRVIAQLAGNTRLGNLNPLIYSLANTQYNTAGFHDVTSGNNNFNGVTGIHGRPRLRSGHRMGHHRLQCLRQCREELARGEQRPRLLLHDDAISYGDPDRHLCRNADGCPDRTISATLTPTAIVSQTPTPTNVATPKPTTFPTATATQLGTRTPDTNCGGDFDPAHGTATPTIAATSTLTVIVMPTPTRPRRRSSEPSGGTLSVPAAVRFPAIGVGMKAVQRTILIANRSASTPLALDIGTLMSPFTVSGAGQFTSPPHGSVPVTIVFTPDVIGTANQTLGIRSGDPKHPLVSVMVSGTVQPGVLSAPSQITLMAKSGAETTKTVTLRNSGKGMLSGTVEQFAPASSLKCLVVRFRSPWRRARRSR